MKLILTILIFCISLVGCKEQAQWEKDFIAMNYSPSIVKKIELSKEHIDIYLKDADRYGSTVINEACSIIEQYQKRCKQNTGVGLVSGTIIFNYNGSTIRKEYDCGDNGLKTNY